MSIKHQNWKWRNRKPTCDQCRSADTHRMRIEVDWPAQVTKTTWKCAQCGNCIFVFSHKKQQQAA